MNRFFKCFCFLFLILFGYISAKAVSNSNTQAKLIIGIVVDQMRYDYLYRFQSHYGKRGFRLLMDGGANCQNAMIPYLPSFTACGHACIYTGSVPAIHGIVGNDWVDKNTGKEVYCVEDKSVSGVGSNTKAGMMSPANLQTSTITDELILASNFRSRAYGISIKDRGAVLPGGHLGTSYWYDDAAKGFISSTFYMTVLPKWVSQFNASGIVDNYYKQNWKLSFDKSYYTESTQDLSAYEGKLPNDVNSAFPHMLDKYIGNDYSVIKRTPFGNSLTLEFAKSLIRNEALGSNYTDFLAISLSSTDYIGHEFGPNSIEIEDTYVKLDEDLESFFNFLDLQYGKGNYILFLTADHGAAHNSQFVIDHKLPGGFYFDKEEVKTIKNLLIDKFGNSDMLLNLMNYNIYLNDDVIKSQKLDKEEILETIVNHYRNDPRVNFVLNFQDMEDWIIPNVIRDMIINGYNIHRSGDMMILPRAQFYSAHYTTGTTHGTWNPYDTHIPLLWYGNSVPKMNINRTVNMTDISATLATMLRIQMPNGCIGQPITELLNN